MGQRSQPKLFAAASDQQRSPLAPFVLIPKAFFQNFSPGWRAVLAFTALKFFANNSTQSCESVPLRVMARRVGTSEDSLRKGILELERMGVVKTRQRSRRSPKGKRIPLPNLYELIHIDENSGDGI